MKDINNFLSYFLSRANKNSFLSIESYNEKKTGGGQVAGSFFNYSIEREKLLNYIKKINQNPNAVYLSLNPLKTKKRKKTEVEKISYLFIDVDKNPTKEQMQPISDFLEKNHLEVCYLSKSGHG